LGGRRRGVALDRFNRGKTDNLKKGKNQNSLISKGSTNGRGEREGVVKIAYPEIFTSQLSEGKKI